MIPLQTAYMLGFTVTFLAATLGVAIYLLLQFHRRVSRAPERT